MKAHPILLTIVLIITVFFSSAQTPLKSIVCDYAYSKKSIVPDTASFLFGHGDEMMDMACSWKCNMRIVTPFSITGGVESKDSLSNHNSASACIIPSPIEKRIIYDVYINNAVIMEDTVDAEDSIGVAMIGFIIANGNRNSKPEYSEYGRLKRVELILNQKSLGSVDLKDTPKVQLVNLGKAYDLSFYKKIKLEIVIKEIYPGTKFKELAISELHIEGFGGHSLVGKFCYDELW